MGKAVAGFSMSLDGFVAALDDSVPYIFDWYGCGSTRFEWPGNGMVSDLTETSASYVSELTEETGALVIGRRLFDYTDGWAGRHPIGVPIFVVSHRGPEGWDARHDPSMTTFVGGVESAMEQAQVVAGSKWVGVAGPNIAQQCLNVGLLDEVRVDLVPVLLGRGIPFFANLANTPVLLDDPTVIVDQRVTHLIYRVSR